MLCIVNSVEVRQHSIANQSDATCKRITLNNKKSSVVNSRKIPNENVESRPVYGWNTLS